MAGYPPPYPPSSKDWKYQRRILRDQARAQRDQYRYQMRGTRRSSILGPVIVVLVGVVFLLIQTGHLRNERLWEWYGHWWPLLLVVAGVVLLIEWGVDQVRPRSTQQVSFYLLSYLRSPVSYLMGFTVDVTTSPVDSRSTRTILKSSSATNMRAIRVSCRSLLRGAR